MAGRVPQMQRPRCWFMACFIPRTARAGLSSVAADYRLRINCPGSLGRDRTRAHSGLPMVHKFVSLDISRKTERAQSANTIPIQIDFVPCKTVTRGLRNRVMIVVPSFAEGKQGDPKTVFRCIVRQETPRSPHVRCGIDQPSGVQAEDGSQKDCPQ